jgi:hypothetical protein
MIVGFTGTRKGLSPAQQDQLGYILAVLHNATRTRPEFHHGGADGADTEADIAACLDGYDIHVHPCPGVVADEENGGFNSHPVKWDEVFPPLVRDRHIAEVADILIAAPETDKEQVRSGTWATVRYARAAGKPVIMLSRGKE